MNPPIENTAAAEAAAAQGPLIDQTTGIPLPTCPFRRDKGLLGLNLLCWGLFIAFLVVPMTIALSGALHRERPAGGGLNVDFVYFYAMGRMFNEYPSRQLYDYELQKQVCTEIYPPGEYGPNPYSPLIGILFRPLARMDFFPAYTLWLSISLLLYLGGVAMITSRFFPGEPFRRSLIFCFALSFCPLFWALGSGQVSMIGFFALALALREEGRQRPMLSGIALSLCMYKPTILILILPMLIITRRYKTLLGFAAGAIGTAGFITAVQGAGVWPGYITRLLSFGAAASSARSFVVHWYHVDLASFSALVPGGRTAPGRLLILGYAAFAGIALVRAWWTVRGIGQKGSTVAWAATLTSTLILNLYVPIHDSIFVVLSLIATAAVLREFPEGTLHKQFTLLWILILASSWITIPVAQSSGVQVLTVLFAVLGLLQLTMVRKLGNQPLVAIPAGAAL